jgi:GNAT superfamily N-acetyltransferase
VAATMLHKEQSQTGVRPFDPFHDVEAVADLIAVAFGDKLDPSGQAALVDMRRAACWGRLLWFLDSPGWGGMDQTPGFVWVEEGVVVGNVSLRRAAGWGGFLIGNVAVHPDWQGRGVGRALMEAALEEVSAQGGHWAGLEVQSDNEVARRLYESLGFVEAGRVLHMLRSVGLFWPGGQARTGEQSLRFTFRRGRGRDGEALFELACAVVSEPQRALLEMRPKDYRLSWQRTLDLWFEGRGEAWWAIEEEGELCGAVRVLRERGRRPDRLEVLVSPRYEGRFEGILVHRALAGLHRVSRRMIEVFMPRPSEPLIAALESAGFQRLRMLVQMRRSAGQCVSVRS